MLSMINAVHLRVRFMTCRTRCSPVDETQPVKAPERVIERDDFESAVLSQVAIPRNVAPAGNSRSACSHAHAGGKRRQSMTIPSTVAITEFTVCHHVVVGPPEANRSTHVENCQVSVVTNIVYSISMSNRM